MESSIGLPGENLTPLPSIPLTLPGRKFFKYLYSTDFQPFAVKISTPIVSVIPFHVMISLSSEWQD